MEYAQFEKVYNTLPHAVRDRHPDGSLVSMQVYAKMPDTTNFNAQKVRDAAIHVLQKMKRPVTPATLALMGVKDTPITTTRLRSAIWNMRSAKLVFAPANTIDLAWLHNGHEIGLVREHYQPLREKPSIFGSPLQAEFTYTWERGSWPERKQVHSCSLLLPTGWPVTLTISPCSDLVALQWMDQTESGLEFLVISDQGDHQVMDTGLPILEHVTDHCFRFDGNGFPFGSNVMSPPAFSPNGRYVAFTWQKGLKWWIDETNAQGSKQTTDFPRKTGICQVGFVEVIDWEQRHVREMMITTTLPQGWQPPLSQDEYKLTSRSPIFIDNEHFTLLLPTREIRTYSVQEEGPTTRLIEKTSQAITLREQAVLEEKRKRENRL